MTLAYRGVIEGFYGRPWTPTQRHDLLARMGAWGMNTYVYGPKDDVKVRAAWRERYDADEARDLGALADAAARHGVALHYAIAPGLDVRYADTDDRRALRAKLEQVLELGVGAVTLLFDDIPAGLTGADRAAFASFGAAHADVANEVAGFLAPRDVPLLLCPTEYCDRFADPSVEASPYLHDLGAALDARVDVYWTGPEIVSETVPSDATRRIARVLGRAPVLWDNLHANDYDHRRVYLGPYLGRGPALRGELRGVITNPNVEAEANAVPLHTTAAWLRGEDDIEAALARAIDAWLPRFATHGGHADREEVGLLVDYLHLPFRHGPAAQAHLAAAARVAADGGGAEDRDLLAERARQLVAVHRRVTELRDRDLAYALYSYVWDLKEEAEVLASYARHPGGPFCRPDALPNTYRTGIVDALQGILPLDADGCVRR
ncbi:MAG: beta-N-acetylglucosaminidase domain-containing protein [Trueperaceae bacterium]|nr:beta-N-acetylglucosaminidase domain-containing protein [Trueperaceae bacterium]